MTDTEQIGAYLDFLYHDTEGWVYAPAQSDPTNPKSWSKYIYEWPRQRSRLIDDLLRKSAAGQNVFVSPALYAAREHAGRREGVLGTWTLWMDWDGNAPEHYDDLQIPTPDLRIQSSTAGHEHTYWTLHEFLTDSEVIEERNRALSYSLGADTSGWDANQILRPPGTENFPAPNKKRTEPKTVTVLHKGHGAHSLDEFGAITSAKNMVASTIVEGELRPIQDIIATKNWPTAMWELFSSDDVPDDRSGAISKLGYFGAENGFSDEDIYVILDTADQRWGKYTGRRDRDKHLVNVINRARQKHGYTAPEDLTFAGLMGAGQPQQPNDDMVFGFGDFLASEYHIEWVLQDMMARNGLGMVVAAPGVGKTQFGIQMAICLALGRDFMLWKNVDNVRLKTLFLGLEMAPAPTHHFLSIIGREYNEHHTLNQNFKVAPLGNALALDLPPGRAYLEKMLSEHQPDFLVIDSLQKIMSKEMNDEVSVKASMEYLATVREKYGCAMLLIHHNRKRAADAGKMSANVDDVYGSRFIGAELDFVINLAKVTDSKDEVAVSMLKNRLGRETENFEAVRNENLTYHHRDYAGLTHDNSNENVEETNEPNI
jgi:hypothetical protein